MSRRKRKGTRKYTPKNEFRRNNSKTAEGHYNYVFGETSTHLKSLGITTHPKQNFKHVKLKVNPNPNDKRTSFLQLRVLNTNKKYFREKETGWKFSKDDMPIVRHTIKDYKKRTNRKPKGWYDKKKKWHKKDK